MKKLLSERFTEYFIAMGYTQLPAKSRKYKLFVLKVVSGGFRWYGPRQVRFPGQQWGGTGQYG